MDKELIDKINELAHLKKTVGLTAEQQTLQDELRKQYLAEIRGQVRQSLENVSIQEKDGTIHPLSKKNHPPLN